MPGLENVYHEFTALLALSAVCGALAIVLRQPLIVAFILVGILAGPAVLGWVRSHDEIDLLAQIGVTVLLFVVGLKLDLHLVRHVGPVALATGLGQLGFTIVFGYLIGLALGMEHIRAIYVAVALTFSSTIIIVKLLSDKHEIDSLHGRIAMGFLIVQDIAVVIAMMVLGTTHGNGDAVDLARAFAGITVRLALATLAIGLLMRFLLPWITHLMARSLELLMLFAIAWGTALATLGELLGFSKEVGAFLAGFSLASTAYREIIGARLTSLRDFLLLFFFIDLGSRLDFSILGQELTTAVVFSVFVLVGNPLIVMAIMGYMGYRKRTGFMAGLTVAQISEFSIVFIAMGIRLGHTDMGSLSLITLVGLVTIMLSTYMILYSQALYERLAPWLGIFERRRPFREMAMERERHATEADVIVYGLGRYGSRLARRLQEKNIKVLGVDFDPEVVIEMRRIGLPTRFGDAENPDFLEHLPLAHTRWVISTLPDSGVNLHLLKALKTHGYAGRIAMTVHAENDGSVLLRAGVDRVLDPFQDAAKFAAEMTAEAIATSGASE